MADTNPFQGFDVKSWPNVLRSPFLILTKNKERTVINEYFMTLILSTLLDEPLCFYLVNREMNIHSNNIGNT